MRQFEIHPDRSEIGLNISKFEVLNLDEVWPLIPRKVLRSSYVDELTQRQIWNWQQIEWVGTDRPGPCPERIKPSRSIWENGHGPWTFQKTGYWGSRYSPKINSPDYFWIPTACHWLAEPMLVLAKAAMPDGEWEIYQGPIHSTVVDYKYERVWDILWHASTKTNTDPRLFAMATSENDDVTKPKSDSDICTSGPGGKPSPPMLKGWC